MNSSAHAKLWPRGLTALLACLLLHLAIRANASEPAALSLLSGAQVDGGGVYLAELVTSTNPLPAVRLCDSPVFGKTTELSRAQVNRLIAAAAPGMATTNWSGAESVSISRRAHALTENAMLALLTQTLQKNCVKDRGELELTLTQPWTEPLVPDDPLTMKILEQPGNGITPSFIVRFELRTARETLGAWQTSVRAQIWRDVWVARSPLSRGQLVADADIVRERYDITNVRDELADFPPGDDSLQIGDFVAANAPLLARQVRPKTVIHRGQTADALIQDGALSIRMRVVALEDGAPGQSIRVRNPVSQRYLTGTVKNSRTISISL